MPEWWLLSRSHLKNVIPSASEESQRIECRRFLVLDPALRCAQRNEDRGTSLEMTPLSFGLSMTTRHACHFKCAMSSPRDITRRMTVAAFQGEPGAYSEQAAFDFFGPHVQPLPRPSFDDVFDDVASAKCDFGVVPVENSLGGSIHRNYDLLMRHNLHIVGEVIVRIRWYLYALPGVQLGDITRVMSHWQALAQTEHTLSRLLPQAEREQVYDTAGSVKMLAEERRSDTAAIAGKRASELYSLPILLEGIEDDPTNYTRFLVLSRDPTLSPLPFGGGAGGGVEANYKTSIVFATRNEPGSLFKSLAAFALRGVDLTKIESRPLQGSPWEYLFYLDFGGHADDTNCRRALDHLSEFATVLRVLGSYPRATMPQ
jgi:prephenate dehydratase